MPAPSLAQLVRRILIKNITSSYSEFASTFYLLILCSVVTDIGDMPYDIIRPILLKLENPQQLVSTNVPCHAHHSLANDP